MMHVLDELDLRMRLHGNRIEAGKLSHLGKRRLELRERLHRGARPQVLVPRQNGQAVHVLNGDHRACKPAFVPGCGGAGLALHRIFVALGTRKPVFRRDEVGSAAGLKPRARIKAFANIGSEPAMMLTGPIDVTQKVLKRAKMTLDDIDLIEINEAFAAVVLRYLQAFELDPGKVNVNGGAIAMGHPLGATGAMILGIAVDELERRDLNTALVTLCIGAGMGTATIIERV